MVPKWLAAAAEGGTLSVGFDEHRSHAFAGEELA
jgi:hypothetical protein